MAASNVGVGAEPDPSAMVFSLREKWGVALLYVSIVVATVLGFVGVFLVGREYGIFIGLGVLAYTLGLRHGVDADHIARSTTRRGSSCSRTSGRTPSVPGSRSAIPPS